MSGWVRGWVGGWGRGGDVFCGGLGAAGILDAMIVTLSQPGKLCPLSVSIDKYGGNVELTKVTRAGPLLPAIGPFSNRATGPPA